MKLQSYETLSNFAYNFNLSRYDLAGTLFWHWYDRGIGPGRFGIQSSDSTFAVIQAHVKTMNAITGVKESCPVPFRQVKRCRWSVSKFVLKAPKYGFSA